MGLKRETINFGNFEVDAYTAQGGTYIVWHDGRRWRWALREWRDDGIGLHSHGAAEDVQRLMECIQVDYDLRQEVEFV